MTRVMLVCASLIAGVLALACGPRDSGESPGAANDWLIVPETRVGPIDSSASERALIERLGPSRVIRRDAYLGEGFCAPGSVIFPGTADSVHVTWTDSTYSHPASVSVTGAGSRWRTPAGVRIGSSLVELESLSGGPIRFMGFGWDYGGSATWTEPVGGDVGIVLGASRASMDSASADPRFREILGERQVSSDHPLIRRMDVRVERIMVLWAEATVQYECRE